MGSAARFAGSCIFTIKYPHFETPISSLKQSQLKCVKFSPVSEILYKTRGSEFLTSYCVCILIMTSSISSGRSLGTSAKEVKKVNITAGKSFSNVFEALIIGLNLEDRPGKAKPSFFGKPSPPFSFSVEDAVQKLCNLTIDIELRMAKTTVAYSMKPNLAFDLLRKFFDAKLFHYPNSRTEAKLSRHGVLQITPKGAALVYAFCQNIGMPTKCMPAIVKSNINTMELFMLERSPASESILYSSYLVHILFSWVMGPNPNIWSSEKASDPATCVFYDTTSEDTFAFSSSSDGECFLTPEEKTMTQSVSPFHHKYFTNPESDSHVQYYVSNTGVRLFKLKTFINDDKKVMVDYCVSGKAIVQWLSDCSSVTTTAEAISIAKLFIEANLLRPITMDDEMFLNERNAFYVLTERGSEVCNWGRRMRARGEQLLNASNRIGVASKGPSLKNILKDPGLRLLFKMHMQKERCVENVNAYVQLSDFNSLEQQVLKLYSHYNTLEDGPRKMKVRNAIEFHTNKFYSKAFQLYSAYISPDLQFDLNIDYKLRQDAQNLMTLEGPMLPSVDYMMTPMVEKEFLGELDITKLDSPASVEKPVYFRYENGDLTQTVAMVEDIRRVFRQIAKSIFRLMEIDSYPKFISSIDYQHIIACDS